jgi:hypothetical protein
MSNERKFNTRSLVTLTVAMSFLTIAISGLVLYISPKGRVANWTGWSVAGLGKEDWAGLHTTMALLFLTFSAVHIWNNWRPLMNYIKKPVAAGVKRSKSEMLAAVTVTLGVLLGTLFGIPPFSTIGALGENMKSYWEARSVSGPYIHAEDDTLADFARKLGREEGDLMERLAAKGYATNNANLKVKDLADQYNITPAALFAALSSGGAGVGPAGDHGNGGGGPAGFAGPGGGFGRMSLAQVCTESNIDLDTAIAALQKMGITAQGTDNLRTLANNAGMNPGELLEAVGIKTGH